MPEGPAPSANPRKIRVRVPATTANLGPGFDCLGMALDIFDTVTLTVGENAEPEGEEDLARQYADLVRLAAGHLYRAVELEPPEFTVATERSIPVGRGLGSSAAAIVAGLMGANTLAGSPMSQESLGELAATIEGHPDNSTPCLYGGFQVCVMEQERLVHLAVPLPTDLQAVLFIPDFPLPTHETRKLLPRELSRADVVFQTSRTALLVAALATNQLEQLHIATQDRLHQPARGALFPGMWPLFEAAREAGALSVYLSGGGPTVVALTSNSAGHVKEAMEQRAVKLGIKGEGRFARFTEVGAVATVVE